MQDKDKKYLIIAVLVILSVLFPILLPFTIVLGMSYFMGSKKAFFEIFRVLAAIAFAAYGAYLWKTEPHHLVMIYYLIGALVFVSLKKKSKEIG